MCAYGSPSVRMYLSASCVRVSMLPFVCVNARVRDCVYVSPSVRPSVCLSVRVHDRACKCLIVQACVHQCMRSCVCMHACVRASVRLSACMFVRPNDCSHMRAFSSMHARHFLFLTSNFHVCTWVFASVRICAHVYPSVRMYLSASCVRVSMLAFVFVHARVRAWGRMCESIRTPVCPFVCLSVCPCACSCVQMFDRTCVRSSMYAFVCLHARVREGVCLGPSVHPSVCPRACSCVQMFVRTCEKE